MKTETYDDDCMLELRKYKVLVWFALPLWMSA
jgi:hypothetical protein